MQWAQRIVGAASRRSPRGRGRAARWLADHPGEAEVAYRDTDGLFRRADLHDGMESQWFAGMAIGVPPAVLDLVNGGDWVIDAGANIGIVSGQLCRRVGGAGLVWAVEPLPRNIARLRQLQGDNSLGQLRVLEVALSDRIGTAQLRLPAAGHSGWGSFTASWNRSGELQVDTTTLDHLVAGEGSNDRRLSLLKVDVEGAEFEVLDGALATLRDHRPRLYLEFNDPLLRDNGRSSRDLLAACADVGYVPVDEPPSAALEGSVIDLLLAPRDEPRG